MSEEDLESTTREAADYLEDQLTERLRPPERPGREGERTTCPTQIWLS